jgi:hypothetical protein
MFARFRTSHRSASSISHRQRWGGLAVVVLLIGLVGMGQWTALAHQVLSRVPLLRSVTAAPDTTTQVMNPAAFTVGNHPNHPDARYPSYLLPSVFAGEQESTLSEFHRILDLYTKRQGVDDNFTIRVFDSETYEVLGVYSVDHLREQWRAGAEMDWAQVDSERRRLTRRMVDYHEDQGHPREDIAVRWGRANQLQEAYERDRPFAEYEIRLAQYLDMSLLPTMLGVVETFNQDDLVSTAGARSRYQMMPYILERFGVNSYALRTANGSTVQVREEQHPLMAMEPAFTVMRGYINAVGHELPGLSAYHTGPRNIFHVYRTFLMNESRSLTRSTSVVDAFVWGLTDGFDTVSEESTFKTRSRGYIPAVMGAMRAYNPNIIDPSQTQRAARVKLAAGTRTTLDDLLGALADERLSWGPNTYSMSMYERFRHLNPHIDLPASDGDGIPQGGNIVLASASGGDPVRFFIPLGGLELLEASRRVQLDVEATFIFDENTYTRPRNGTRTAADEAYDRLVDRIGQFGFTDQNREQLITLRDRFRTLAEENPSHYRTMQLRIIETHWRVWGASYWHDMERTATAATELTRITPQALHPFDIEDRPPTTLPASPIAEN